MPLNLAFAFVAGMLTFVAPCTLPMVPLVLGAGSSGSARRLFGLTLGFGASFILVSVLLASLLGAAGFSTSQLRLGSALVLAGLGASLAVPALGRVLERRLAPLGRFAPRAAPPSNGFLTGIAIGAAIGIVWAPCVGPIMAAVLAVAVTSGPTPATLVIAVAYVAGAAIPLLVVAAFGRRALRAAGPPRRRAWVQQAFGAMMMVAALTVATGYDVPLESAVVSASSGGSDGGVGPASAVARGTSGPADTSGLPPPLATDLPANVPLDDLGPAPGLQGITAWINSAPLTLASLRGKVVLIHFWTFACINCLHVQPYVKAWYARYSAAGFLVLGIHTPELSFERDLGNVQNAVTADGVTFPVAFDPAYATWNAYHNAYWPAFYFVDKAGRIRHVHFGEGDYAASEQVIRELLAEPQ
ncbi:MAG: cytochrome c biogenesis protein/redoxin [Candidatus Limnocylindrales bacterium]